MKQKFLIAIAFILLISIIGFVNAELSVSGFRGVVGNNETRNSMTLSIDDTSPNGILKSFGNNISIYVNHYINSTIPSGETVALCFYKGQQTKNEYDADGNLINSTIIIDTAVYNYSATSIRNYILKDKDALQVDLNCFWDTKINDTLFQYLSPSIIGLSANSFSFSCGECARQDYEEIVTTYIQAQKITADYLRVYVVATDLTSIVMEFWLVVYWVLRIFIILIIVGLAFASVIWLYQFVKNLQREM